MEVRHFAVNEDMVIEDDYDVESQEETPALEVYSNYQDLLAVDLDGLDLDNGSDDDVILAMLVTLIGGRDAVINYVAVHWPQYVLRVNKERIEAERRRKATEQQDAEDKNQAIILAQRKEIERLKAEVAMKTTPMIDNSRASEQSATPVTPVRQKKAPWYSEMTAPIPDGEKKPPAKPNQQSGNIQGGTRDVVHFQDRIMASEDGQSVIVASKEDAIKQAIRTQGQLRTAHPANQLQEHAQGQSDADLNAPTDESTPGTNAPPDKRTKRNTPPDDDALGQQIPTP